MAKKVNIVIIVIVLLALFLIVANMQGIFPFAVVSSIDFTPIFCNDYEFTCCTDQRDSIIPSVEITDEEPWLCPLFALECSYQSFDIDPNTAIGLRVTADTWIGSSNCRFEPRFFGDRWKCSDETQTSRRTLFPGEYVWVMSVPKTVNVKGRLNSVEIRIQRLDFCGASGCSQGIPVSGADQCKFNPPTSKIYSTIGQATQASSFTVPVNSCVLSFQQGNRHICGYKEESCTTDSQCGGHTFGNVECIGRTKQTYGCRSFGTPTALERDRRAGIDNDFGQGDVGSPNAGNILFGKRCDLVRAEQVQCCGDTDCGFRQFCDVNTFTCKEKVQCTTDSQCGVSVQCDFTTTTLKTPVCRNNECAREEVNVDCCNDRNCPSGEFCQADRTCSKRIVTKQECPFECCKGEDLYFDRACSDDSKPFCVKNQCLAEPGPRDKCESCDAFALSSVLKTVFGKDASNSNIGFVKDNICEPKLLAIPPQTNTTCSLSFVKLVLIPVSLIFSYLLLLQLLLRFPDLKRNKNVRISLSIGLSLLIAWLIFKLFFVGIIALILLIVWRASVGGQIQAVRRGLGR